MPRPDEVTDELIAEYDAEMDPKWAAMLNAMPKLRESARAGCWVGDKLRDLGATEDEVERTCTAAGQVMAMSPDVWEVAKQVVARYEADRTHEMPGAELAKRLIQETGL